MDKLTRNIYLYVIRLCVASLVRVLVQYLYLAVHDSARF